MSRVHLYDESAQTYHRRYQQIQQMKYQAIIPYLQNRPVVDVGIGTGIGIPYLSPLTPVVGLDASIEMLRFTSEFICGEKRRIMTISLVCASAEALPLRNNIFPSTVSITVLQNLEDKRKGLQELVRITHPGGLLAITALAKIVSLEALKALINDSLSIIKQFETVANEDVGLVLQVIK